MGSVNISIKDEAYKFLKSLRKENESFSDVILSFKDEKGSKDRIMRFFGVLKNKNINWSEREKRMKEFRDSFEKRINKTSEDMEQARKK